MQVRNNNRKRKDQVLTKDGVSSSLIGFPSKRNRTAPVVIPCKSKYTYIILQIPLKCSNTKESTPFAIHVHYSTALHMQRGNARKVITCVANWYSAGNKVLWLHRQSWKSKDNIIHHQMSLQAKTTQYLYLI